MLNFISSESSFDSTMRLPCNYRKFSDRNLQCSERFVRSTKTRNADRGLLIGKLQFCAADCLPQNIFFYEKIDHFLFAAVAVRAQCSAAYVKHN